MRELIDREQLLKDMGDRPKVSVHGLYALGAVNQYDCDRLAVETAPTVDAVEVVRCKDCKSFSHGYCRFHDAKFVRLDGYCYWGEGKEGEQHD